MGNGGGPGRRRGRIRVDELLVQRGLAPDLAKARALVMAGQVVAGAEDPGALTAADGRPRLGARRVDKSSELVDADEPLRVRGVDAQISRAAGKLRHAVEELGLEARFKDAAVLDVGASTGGFTQVSLALGARRVVAVDVGQNQLAWELRTDPRVTCIERTDVRNLTHDQLGEGGVGIVVADVSFISLARLIPTLVSLAGKSALYVLLVKPQFELPRELVPEGGVVEDDELRQQAANDVIAAMQAEGLGECRVVDSQVAGRAGNRELFVVAGF